MGTIQIKLNRRTVAIASLIIGVISMLLAAGADTAPEGTYNIGLLQSQMIAFQFGGLCVLVATILFASQGGVREQIQ